MGCAHEDGWISRQGGTVCAQREKHTSRPSLFSSPLGLNSSFSFCRKTRLLWSVSWRQGGGGREVYLVILGLHLQD